MGKGKACREDPGRRAPARSVSEIFLTNRRPATRPAHVEKRRHGGRIKSAQPSAGLAVPHSLLDRSTVPLLRPRRRPEEEEACAAAPATSLGSANPSPSPDSVVVTLVSRWAGRSGRLEMMDEAPADLRELVRLPDVLVVCSSTGWTDEKHMLYLQLLEETFVSQLHDGERSFKGLFNLSPRYCGQGKSSKQIIEYAKPDQCCICMMWQGCHGIVDADRVKPCMNVELMDSPSCCGNQQDGKIHSTDDNASTTEPVEEAISQARTTSSGQSSTCYVGKHRHSPSRSAEGSDQNFDEETKGTGESRRGCSQKRLKSYNIMRDDEVQKAGLIACDKHKDKYNGSLKVDAGSLDAEAGSPT